MAHRLVSILNHLSFSLINASDHCDSLCAKMNVKSV